MQCYIYRNEKETRLTTEELIQKSVSAYRNSTSQSDDEKLSREVLRTEKGKPYFKELPIKFSVSHSRDIWLCVISDIDVGIDIQEMKNSRYQRIAERYFTEGELRYMKAGPEIERFYEIWTRKESYGKLLGIGISDGMLKLDTILAEQKEEIIFQRIDVCEEFICTCCSREKRKIWIKKIV